MKVGIIFGGPAGERELSYAGGRTVYDNLDKFLFEAVPVFADSLGNFILLDWQNIYKSGIRNFYPPTEVIPESEHQIPVYIESLGNLSSAHQTEIISRVGRQIFPSDFKSYFDFAFLVLPDFSVGEKSLHSLLNENYIPHSGPGILAAAISSDRFQLKQELAKHGFSVAPFRVVPAKDWAEEENRAALFQQLQQDLGLPLVLKPAAQPAPLRNYVIRENNFTAFAEALEQCLGQKTIYKEKWQKLNLEDQLTQVNKITHIRTGIGLPVTTRNDTVIHHPEQLFRVINRLFTETSLHKLTLYATGRSEALALVEAAPAGTEFACLVMRDEDGQPLALAPEIFERKTLAADENTSYLNPEPAQIARIRQACQRWCGAIDFKAYASLQGFTDDAGEIYLDDVQVTPEILPASLVFRQATQIGLNPTQFLTHVIRTSLARHLKLQSDLPQPQLLLHQLDTAIQENQQQRQRKISVGIIMGGDSEGANQSVASGRYIYGLLSASAKYYPVPVFRLGSTAQPRYYILPLNILWENNGNQIREKLTLAQEGYQQDVVLDKVRAEANQLTTTFAGPLLREPQYIYLDHLKNLVDTVFIALPGPEAEAGALQAALDKLQLPYSGSGLAGLLAVNDKIKQHKILHRQGLSVPNYLTGDTVDLSVDKGEIIHFLTVSGIVLTKYLPDGRLDYEVLALSEMPAEKAGFDSDKQFLDVGSNSIAPARFAPDPQVCQVMANKVKADFKKAAQGLNIDGYVQLDAWIKVKQNQELETIIKNINLFPALIDIACVFQGAAANGYTPYEIVDRILQFSLQRQKQKVQGNRHTDF